MILNVVCVLLAFLTFTYVKSEACNKKCRDYYYNCDPVIESDKPDEIIDCTTQRFQLRCPEFCSVCAPCEMASMEDLEESQKEMESKLDDGLNDVKDHVDNTVDDLEDKLQKSVEDTVSELQDKIDALEHELENQKNKGDDDDDDDSSSVSGQPTSKHCFSLSPGPRSLLIFEGPYKNVAKTSW